MVFKQPCARPIPSAFQPRGVMRRAFIQTCIGAIHLELNQQAVKGPAKAASRDIMGLEISVRQCAKQRQQYVTLCTKMMADHAFSRRPAPCVYRPRVACEAM